MKRKTKALSVLALILVAAAVVFAQPRVKVNPQEPEKMPETYSIKTFLNPNWEIAMHEVFTHYLQAASTFGQGDYDTTISFLKCTEYYIALLPNLIPDKTPPPENKPINKVEFRKDIENLRTNIVGLRKMVESKDYKKATTVAPDIVTKLCSDCHKKAKIPPKWQMGGYKVVE
jgi:hypothetical protein